jgi:pyroglutamyl-peptidase
MNLSAPEVRVLVTGFSPFGDHPYNPSWDAARAIALELDCIPRLLPVTFTTAAQFARAHLTAAHPLGLFFIHLGLAAGRERLALETCARNRRDDTPDNLEKTLPIRMPRGERPLISEDRPERRPLLPLSELARAYESIREDLPAAELSDDCGHFVCNALFYHSLRACEAARARGQLAQALFFHLPPMTEELARRTGTTLARALRETF